MLAELVVEGDDGDVGGDEAGVGSESAVGADGALFVVGEDGGKRRWGREEEAVEGGLGEIDHGDAEALAGGGVVGEEAVMGLDGHLGASLVEDVVADMAAGVEPSAGPEPEEVAVVVGDEASHGIPGAAVIHGGDVWEVGWGEGEVDGSDRAAGLGEEVGLGERDGLGEDEAVDPALAQLLEPDEEAAGAFKGGEEGKLVSAALEGAVDAADHGVPVFLAEEVLVAIAFEDETDCLGPAAAEGTGAVVGVVIEFLCDLADSGDGGFAEAPGGLRGIEDDTGGGGADLGGAGDFLECGHAA